MPFHRALDGTRIHYRDVGVGPEIVLIPGLGGDGAFWSGVEALLAPRHRLIVVDHRGAGASDRPDGSYSIPLIANDVLGIASDAELECATYVGHSTGGMIAQTIATTVPDRVDRLILSATWERPDLRFRRLFEARIGLLEHAGPVAFHKLTQALGYDGDWIEANAATLDAELATAAARLSPVNVQIARMRMLLTHDCADLLPLIGVPTLVLGAVDDALIPVRHAAVLARLIPKARMMQMTGGHFYPRAYPALFAAALTTFLKETA